MKQDHNQYMKRCLELAEIAKTKGATAVGSVVVSEGRIIGEGVEGAGKLPGMIAHAEMIAILNACEKTGTGDLSPCLLYTTVEPCFMCAYLIRQTKIAEVIFGVKTPETGGASSEFPFLRSDKITKWAPAPKITKGIMAAECATLLKK